MKHKVKIIIEKEKRCLFGKKKVREEKIIEVDDKTYKELQNKKNNHQYTIEEMMFYDELFDEDI